MQAWVLDTVPAEVPTGAGGGPAGAALDHPRALIEALRDLPEPIETRNQVLDTLLQQGMVSTAVAEAVSHSASLTRNAYLTSIIEEKVIFAKGACMVMHSDACAPFLAACRLH